MPYRLGVNEPVQAHVRFADLMPGEFGPSVKLKADIDGTTEHLYLPGTAADVLTQLHDARVVREIPRTLPAAGERPVPLALAAHDIVLELKRDTPRGPRRLVVSLARPEAPAPLPPPRSPGSAPAVRPVAAKPGSSAPAATTPANPSRDDARARCETRRRQVTAAFREALTIALEDLAPLMERHQVQATGDVVYKMAFSLFQGWREASPR